MSRDDDDDHMRWPGAIAFIVLVLTIASCDLARHYIDRTTTTTSEKR